MQELKKQISEKERDLELEIIKFNKEKAELFQKAKQEALEIEQKKTQKHMKKLERIKEQELAIAKKELANSLQISYIAPSTAKTVEARAVMPAVK